MPFSNVLAARVRAVLDDRPDVSERRMFGGLAFMVGGKMAVGVSGDELMVRVGTAAHRAALAEPHVRPMDFTGRPMSGFVYVAAEGLADDADLERWVREAAAFATSLAEEDAARPKRQRRARR